jgi:hypothetical protein
MQICPYAYTSIILSNCKYFVRLPIWTSCLLEFFKNHSSKCGPTSRYKSTKEQPNKQTQPSTRLNHNDHPGETLPFPEFPTQEIFISDFRRRRYRGQRQRHRHLLRRRRTTFGGSRRRPRTGENRGAGPGTHRGNWT